MDRRKKLDDDDNLSRDSDFDDDVGTNLDSVDLEGGGAGCLGRVGRVGRQRGERYGGVE